jgi:mono/diheme cytochrome c family protein
MKPVRGVLAVLVVAIAALVLLGVGQGHPGPLTPVTASAQAKAKTRIAALGAKGQQGQALFHSQGCDDCHTIGVSGAGGRLGPNLDGYLAVGYSTKSIIALIEDPPTTIPGFTKNLMPSNFGKRLTASELQALAAYIHAAAG